MKKISELKGYLIDLDGTLYLGNLLIPGAIEYISSLRQKEKKILFLSNNSAKSRTDYVNKLKRLGIEVNQEEILTSTIASADFLMKNFPDAIVYPVGTPEFEAELISLGINISYENADVVLLGFDTSLTYEKIKKAARLICYGASFIATHGDLLCPTEDGFIPDIGTLIPIFEKATNKSPTIIGKPFSSMIESVLSRLNLMPEFIGMVGDRLYTDIAMAKTYGLTSILVLSGETKITDLSGSAMHPDYIFPSVREIIPFI
ncbi:MAG: HAD-IIA family hydrolase [Methanolinea tarda]|jgi:HAD superfamily hydrolase (TIGR01450 family)